MAARRVHVGCSGWNYVHWRNGVFYPPRCPPRRWLSFYSEQFDSVEVNATFYRLPTLKTVEGWAARTPEDFVLQFDVGPAVQHGIDAPAWIRGHAGRIRSVHLRDWSATKGYNIAFGEGDCPWPAIFEAAEDAGIVETYLVENGHSTPDEEFPIAARSIANWRRLRG